MYPASFFCQQIATKKKSQQIITKGRNKERRRRLPYGWKTKAIANANAQKTFVIAFVFVKKIFERICGNLATPS